MRKTENIVLGAEFGRDAGKTFRITEMSAMRAEKWATKALLCLARSGQDVPESMARQGMSAMVIYGLNALSSIEFAEAEPLLDEMMGCVQIVETAVTRRPTEDDYEEVRTLFYLRQKIFELHTGFSFAGSPSET